MATPAAKVEANATLGSALADARSRYVAANPNSHALHQEAARHLPGGNTRTSLYYDPFPLRFTGGHGCRLRDSDGHDYVDFLSEYTVGMFGHSNPIIREAIISALDFGLNIGGHTELEGRMAAAVTGRFASMERVRFTNSGTEANLMAVTLARAFTRRTHVMVFTGGYHGALLYFRDGGSPVNAPYPTIVGTYNDPEGARALAHDHADQIACILVEPMFGSTGCIPGTDAFLHALRGVADEIGALLIFDEVMTSRLAPGGLQSIVGIKPDLTTLGKYVGGGMSFGAFGGRKDIMDLFDPSKPNALPHAGTFNNNVLTMSAGIAALTRIVTPEASVAVNARGDRLRERLNGIARSGGAHMQFTGRGTMLGVHFCSWPVHNEADASRANQPLKELLFFDLLDRGVYIARRGMIVLSLAHDEAAFSALESAVEEFVHVRKPLLAN